MTEMNPIEYQTKVDIYSLISKKDLLNIQSNLKTRRRYLSLEIDLIDLALNKVVKEGLVK